MFEQELTFRVTNCLVTKTAAAGELIQPAGRTVMASGLSICLSGISSDECSRNMKAEKNRRASV